MTQWLWLVPDAVHEGAQFAGARGMAQLTQRLGLDLTDAFASDGEGLADLFQRVLAAILQAEAHFDDLLLARGERAQHMRRLLLEVDIDYGVGGGDHGTILAEVAQEGILFFSDRGLERNGL